MFLASMMILSALAIPRAIAVDPSVVILPSTQTFGPANCVGTHFNITCEVHNVTNLYGADIQLTWDTTWIRHVTHQNMVPVETHPGGVLHSPTILVKDEVDEINPIPGLAPETHYWLAEGSMAPAAPFTGSGVVFRMEFVIYKQPSAGDLDVTTGICFTSVILVDSSGYSIPGIILSDGAVTIKSKPYPPEPLLEVKPQDVHWVPQGSTFYSFISLVCQDALWDVAEFNFTVYYDTTQLAANNVTIDPNGWFASFWPNGTSTIRNEINNAAGKIRVVFFGVPGVGGVHTAPHGEGEIVKVTFQAKTHSHIYPPPSSLIALNNVTIGGFPHPERLRPPWSGSSASPALPYSVHNGKFTVIFAYVEASFTVSPRGATPGCQFTFNASASRVSGSNETIESYVWNFGDGANGSGKIVTHAYSTANDYTVTLNVTTSDGHWMLSWHIARVVDQLIHDVAVTSIRIENNVRALFAGDNATIYVDASNPGYFTETFNVTAYADKNTSKIGDEIAIGTQSLTLPSGTSTTLSFTWNTAGAQADNYTISATAFNTTNDADLIDNVYLDGKIEVLPPSQNLDFVDLAAPTNLTLNPSLFSYSPVFWARLVNIGDITIRSTGFQGHLEILGSNSGTISLCPNQPNVSKYVVYVPAFEVVKVPLWLMFQPGGSSGHEWEMYSGNFTLMLNVGGVYKIRLEIVGISINVCQNGAYQYSGTASFIWNLTGGCWVYLKAETRLPAGWSYTVDPPVDTLFETPHIIRVNITVPPDAEPGEIGTVTLSAYENATGNMFWRFVYFATTDDQAPTIEEIEPATLTPKGDLLFNATIKDASGIEGVFLIYSINDGPWNNQTMQWNSGDTFNSTSYTVGIPHLPDNSVIKYYIIAKDWLKKQTQSDIKTLAVRYDLAITIAETCKTVVGQGFTTRINATIKNNGTIPTASFKVAFYANTTLIHIQTIPFLMNGTTAFLAFNWNTTDIPKGTYKITAIATAVPGETDTLNNVYTAGTVQVTIPGDVDGDFDVDIFDIVQITSRYGKIVPPVPPDSNADIDGNGVVNIFDVVICTGHYGQKTP
jgi:hypothetical protein